MKKAILGLASLVLVASSAFANAETWEIDNAHSSATFKVRHILTKVTGIFEEISGSIVFDPENPAAGSAEITIPVSSINTRNEKRDGHLQSEDFFDEANHPNLTFKSTKFVQTDSGLRVEGILNMRGIDKPVTLNVDYLGTMGGEVAGFSATTTVNRQDWGISWNKVLDEGTILGDSVEVQIDLEVRKKA